MKTLNYWLGVLSKLQLFGHGTKNLVVQDQNGKQYTIGSIDASGDTVVVHIA